MKIVEIKKTEFKKMISMFETIINKKTKLPVLRHVKMAIKEKTVTFSVTDLENELSISYPTECDDMEMMLSIRAMKRYLEIAGKFVRFDYVPPVEIGGFECQMDDLDVNDFPSFTIENQKEVGDFSLLHVANCLKVISKDDSRRAIKQINITKNRIAGTDGKRVMWYDYNNPVADDDVSLLPMIKKNIIGKIIRYSKNTLKAIAEVTCTDDFTVFNIANIRYATRNFEGNYPKIDDVIPASFSKYVDFQANELSQCCKAFIKDDYIEIDLQDECLIVNEQAKIDTRGTATGKFRVNPRFMVDYLGTRHMEICRIRFNVEYSPIKIDDNYCLLPRRELYTVK